MLTVRVTNLFTQGGQDNYFGNIGSVSLTMVEARALKDALYNSEENVTEWKWEAKFVGLLQTIKSPLAQVSQCHPGMWGQPDYADLQGDPGGYEHCVWRALRKPHYPYPLIYMRGGGST